MVKPIEAVHKKQEIGRLIDSLNAGRLRPHQGVVRCYPGTVAEYAEQHPDVYAVGAGKYVSLGTSPRPRSHGKV